MPILKQKNAKSTEKVAFSKEFKPKVKVCKEVGESSCLNDRQKHNPTSLRSEG